jgi:pimeloyl-ACP methyl ester carboxylesterase
MSTKRWWTPNVLMVSLAILLLPASARALTCVPTAAACLLTNEAEPIGPRVPLILIHGWNPRSVPAPPLTEVWANFALHYARHPSLQAAFKLYAFSYASNAVSLPALAGALRDVLDLASAEDPVNFGSKPIVVLAHSLGGLIARAYLPLPQQLGPRAGETAGDRVIALLTLATPHHGSVLANGPAAIVRAGPIFGPALAQFNQAFFSAGGPDFSQPNRSDLRWDNFDGLLNYQAFPGERNQTLEALNLAPAFADRIVAYAGTVIPTPACGLNLFCLGSQILLGGFGLPSDGLVPLSSALLVSAFGLPQFRSRLFGGYDHSEMAAGEGLVVDPFLFGQIQADLLGAIAGLAPASPVNLRAIVVGDTVTLTWDEGVGGGQSATFVVVAGSTTGSSDLAILEVGATRTFLVVQNVAPGTYFVRIHSRNSRGTSGPSNEVIVTVP